MTQLSKDYIFLSFAMTESERALQALDDVDALSDVRIQRQPGVEVRENQRVFNHIRLALQFAANLSKIFWPHHRAKERGVWLRELTRLPDRHPLSDRRLRNHIEHFDERLDDWASPSPRPFLTTELVLHEDYPLDRRDTVIRATTVVYDACTKRVVLFGDEFSLPELRAAVLDVQSKISAAVQDLLKRPDWTSIEVQETTT